MGDKNPKKMMKKKKAAVQPAVEQELKVELELVKKLKKIK